MIVITPKIPVQTLMKITLLSSGVSWGGRLVWSAALKSPTSQTTFPPTCTVRYVATALAAPELTPTT